MAGGVKNFRSSWYIDWPKLSKNFQVHTNILEYYRHFNTNKFVHQKVKALDRKDETRTLHMTETVFRTKDNFPGMMKWSPLEGEPEISKYGPLDIAVINMKKQNQRLADAIHKYYDSKEFQNSLDSVVNGTVGKKKIT